MNEIAKALAAAQLEMSNPRFDSQNPHFRNKFASLASVRNAVVPVLARHGIAMTQNLETTERGIGCTTTLWHESGSLVFGPLVMPATKPDAQGYGSAATYARRYSLMAVCGVVGDDDDDANAATGKPSNGQGIGVHSPLGDLDPAVEDIAIKYADAFREAVTPADAKGVESDLNDECDPSGERWGDVLKLSVWAKLDSKSRSRIKKLLAEKEISA